MDYRNHITLYLINIICTMIGIKYLIPYRIRSIDDFEKKIIDMINIIANNTIDSMLYILLPTFIVIFGISIVIILTSNIISSFKAMNVKDQIFHSAILLLLWINGLISLYLISIFIFLFLILAFLVFVMVSGGSFTRGGPVFVRGHIRNGRFVRSHTRRRPRR